MSYQPSFIKNFEAIWKWLRSIWYQRKFLKFCLAIIFLLMVGLLFLKFPFWDWLKQKNISQQSSQISNQNSRDVVQNGGINIAKISAKLDDQVYRSGTKSLKIMNDQPRTPHLYGSTAQIIPNLELNTDYEVAFWIKTEGAKTGTFLITVRQDWLTLKSIESGTYDWQEYKTVFNTGNDNWVDFRILSEEPGVVWVDDISVIRKFQTK